MKNLIKLLANFPTPLTKSEVFTLYNSVTIQYSHKNDIHTLTAVTKDIGLHGVMSLNYVNEHIDLCSSILPTSLVVNKPQAIIKLERSYFEDYDKPLPSDYRYKYTYDEFHYRWILNNILNKYPARFVEERMYKLPGISIRSFKTLDVLLNNILSNGKQTYSFDGTYFKVTENIPNNNKDVMLLEGVNLYKEIVLKNKILDDINCKGFINNTDLNHYPIIKECCRMIMRDLSEFKALQTKYGTSYGSYVSLGGTPYAVKDVMVIYRWSYSLIVLKLMLYCEWFLAYSAGKGIDNDLLLDFKNLSKLLSSKLEPSIREKFMSKGISYINNIYTGFDTEYVSINSTNNKLLSIQMAISTALMLKMPKKVDFEFEEFNVFTNDVYKRDVEDTEKLKSAMDVEFVKNLINSSIDYYRILNNRHEHDITLKKLINGLKVKDIRFIDKNDCIIFIFDNETVRDYYKTIDSYSFKELVLTSNDLAKNDLDIMKEKVKLLLDSIYKSENIDLNFSKFDSLNEYKDFLERNSTNLESSSDNKLNNFDRELKNGKFKRSYNQTFTQDKISVTNVVNNYIIGHFTTADLCMLNDFNILKDELDIINKSYVTISKPLNVDGVNVYIRDTMLLAPGSKKSLLSIGSLYENIPKIDIGNNINNMEEFLLKDPEKFKEYAIRDALITMVHARYMEYFNNSLGGVGIPLTLSGLSTKFINKYWSEMKYKGYQISKKYLLSNVSTTLTPKGLNVTKDIGIKSTMYIASYRGGRNESFMYGYEFSDKIWYDYDLVSAYTSGMAALGTPDYGKGHIIYKIDELTFDQIFNSYTILNVTFNFKSDTKYPSIPVNIDENTTVYPLKGSAVITGLEYLVAKNQGCTIKVKEGYRVPFVKSNELNEGKMLKPFASCIKEIQRLRSLYEKGTIGNLIYKEIGNSVYGLTVRGLNDKTKYDIRSQGMKRMVGNELSNPLIASWITAFIRSVIGELLHYTQKLGGKVVSVTTDGFITDIEDLESKIMNLQDNEKHVKSLLKEYRKLRKYLSSSVEGLEVKKSGKDIMSWTTRGQLSESSGIMAATGFQKGAASLGDVQKLFIEKMKSSDKSLLFLRTSLRSALDIYNDGGHVTRTYSDQIFRLMFDNKRRILSNIDENITLLDSMPLEKADIGELLRYIGNLPKSKQYSRNTSTVNANKYNNDFELVIRNFIKALLNNELGLDIKRFNGYKSIVTFIRSYNDEINISENYISQLKRRGSFVKVPWSIEAEKFVNYVKIKFPNFDTEKLWKEGSVPAQIINKERD